MATEQRPAHSPLGASGAERWMNCAGSVALLKHLQLPETDEPEYRTLGTSAHDLAKVCFEQNTDAWERIGETFGHHQANEEMSNAVQMFLDECRQIVAAHPGGTMFVECPIDAPEFHAQFYGTLDWGYVLGDKLWVRDYKHGEGIAVDAEWNPQLMYYCFGLLRRFPSVTSVDMGIVQPRAFHGDGPIRGWACPADTIRAWANDTLRPAMDRTSLDADLDAGRWCRFCPAKLVCPLMTSLYGAAMTSDPKHIVNLSDEGLGRSYQYLDAVKMYIKAMEEEAFRRLNAGRKLDGTKLVAKKSNRVFKDGAELVFKEKYGEDAYSKPELKSPAEMSRIGEAAKELVNEWAYKPDAGLTVASRDDRRPEIVVRSITEHFGAAAAALDKPAVAE
jgi:uncharacterized protein DUF2800